MQNAQQSRQLQEEARERDRQWQERQTRDNRRWQLKLAALAAVFTLLNGIVMWILGASKGSTQPIIIQAPADTKANPQP